MKKGMYKMVNIYTKKDQDIYGSNSIKKYNPEIGCSREIQLSARLSMVIARNMMFSFRSVAKNIVLDMSTNTDEKGEKHGWT